MKNFLCLLLCTVLSLGAVTPALAQTDTRTPVVDTSDAAALAALDGTVALCVGQNAIFHHGEKHTIDTNPRVVSGRTLVPVRAVSEAFGLRVDWDETTQTVTIAKNIKLVIGKNEMTLADGSIYLLDVPAETYDGRTCIPLRALCEQALGKTVHWNERGVIVISDAPVADFEQNAGEIFAYFTYDRPNAEKILALFNSENGGTHPRILANKAHFERVLSDAKTNAQAKAYAADVIKQADQYLKSALPTYNIPDGLRLLETSRDVYARAKFLSMAYLLTEDRKYADSLYAVYTAAGNFPDWNPRHFLDTAEMTCAFSIGYDWLYPIWTDEQKSFLANAIYEMGLKPGYEGYYGNFPENNSARWTHNGSNWGVVCNSGMAMGAIAIFEQYPAMCAEILTYAIRDVEYAFGKLFPDGAWYEGISYWYYLMRYGVNMFASLDACFGTDFGLTDTYSMDKTAAFALASGGPLAINNFHDAGQSHLNPDIYFYLANIYNDPDITAIHKYQMQTRGVPATALDLLWYNPETDSENFDFALDHYFRDTELVSMRSTWIDKNSPWLSYHAGLGKANHSHLDSGSYVLDMENARWVIDLPADDYNLPGYFGGKRYEYYRTRPEGHNLYVINPQDGSEGQVLESFSTVETLVSKPKGSYSIVDLTPAYATWTNSARRGYWLENGRRSILVRDEIDLKEENSEIFWFIHTSAKIELLDNRTVRLTTGGKNMLVRIDTNIENATLSVMDAKPLPTSPVHENQNPNEGFAKLCLNGKASDKVYIQVRYIMENDPAANAPLPTKTLDEWQIADGALQPLPTLNSLSANGKVLADYAPGKRTYSTVIDLKDGMPKIETTTAENIVATIEYPQTVGEAINVRVAYKDDPDTYNIYTIEPQIADMQIDYNDESFDTFLEPDLITGSGGDTNPPFQIADNSLAKPWTANGTHHVIYHYNHPVTLGGLALSCGSGDKRIYTFDVDISMDGVNWTNIAKGLNNSGTTTDFEYYNLGNHEANYIKFTGYGYDKGTWNNFNELCFYTDAAQYERDRAVRAARFAKLGADLLVHVGETNSINFKCLGEEEITAIEVKAHSDKITADSQTMTITGKEAGTATINICIRLTDGVQYTKNFEILIQ